MEMKYIISIFINNKFCKCEFNNHEFNNCEIDTECENVNDS